MDAAALGVVLDSFVLIAGERRKLTAADTVESIQKPIGDVPPALTVVTVAEVGHGICRADTPEIRKRRRLFLDELNATVPIDPVTEATAEIIARIGGEQAAKKITDPPGDLMIGAGALELGHPYWNEQRPRFSPISGLSVIQI